MTSVEFIEKKIHLIDKELWVAFYDEMYFVLDMEAALEVVEFLKASNIDTDRYRKEAMLSTFDMEIIDWVRVYKDVAYPLKMLLSGFRNWLGYSPQELQDMFLENISRWDDLIEIDVIDPLKGYVYIKKRK